MASLGVLSKNYREAAIKLMEKSLDFKFPEKKEKQDFGAISAALMEAEMLAKEAEAKEEEYQHHLDEMEAQGYDMTEWRTPPEVVTDEAELAELIKEEEAQAMSEAEKQKKRDAMGCNQECNRCMRTHCPYRKAM